MNDKELIGRRIVAITNELPSAGKRGTQKQYSVIQLDDGSSIQACVDSPTIDAKGYLMHHPAKKAKLGAKPVRIGKDGRCECNCGTVCPLGKAGMSERCTRAELVAGGVPVI